MTASAALVVQTSFLGDVVLTTPLLEHLARTGPVDVVCTPAGAALLANNPAVREVIVYDKRRRDRGPRGFVALVRRLRARRYAAAYLAQASPRSGALAFSAGIPQRVGFAGAAGRAFYSTRVPAPEGMHHAARLLSLATGEPLPPTTRAALRPRLYPGDAERAAVDGLLTAAHAATDRLVAVAPGSVWATKRWPFYVELSALLRYHGRVVVVGADADRALAERIVASSDGRAIDATGQLSLLGSAELIRRAAVLVTNDSSPLHLGSAMNTPTVAIFGPTVPEFGFGPLADRSRVAGHPALACRPCDRHGPQRCPLGHWRCMREISPDAVAALARELLDGTAVEALTPDHS